MVPYGPYGLITPAEVRRLAAEDRGVLQMTQEWEQCHGAFVPLAHLCGEVATLDPTKVAAHVSHYEGKLLDGTRVPTGAALCLRTTPVARLPQRAALLAKMGFHFVLDASGVAHEEPNTAETLIFRGKGEDASVAEKADALNLHGDGNHQTGPVVGVCGGHTGATQPKPVKSGALPKAHGWLVIVQNKAEFDRKGLEYDPTFMVVLPCHAGGGYIMGGTAMQSLYLHGKLPVVGTAKDAPHVMYMLRHYLPFSEAQLRALEADDVCPPRGTVVAVNWANVPESALQWRYIVGPVRKALSALEAAPNARFIRNARVGSECWLPGTLVANNTVAQVLHLCPHPKGASLQFASGRGQLMALALSSELKKAKHCPLDMLAFDGEGRLELTHFARRTNGMPLEAYVVKRPRDSQLARTTVRVFLGGEHQMRRYFCTCSASGKKRWVLYLADCTIDDVLQRADGTVVLTLRERPGHALARALLTDAAGLTAHRAQAAAQNAPLLQLPAPAAGAADAAQQAGAAPAGAAPPASRAVPTVSRAAPAPAARAPRASRAGGSADAAPARRSAAALAPLLHVGAAPAPLRSTPPPPPPAVRAASKRAASDCCDPSPSRPKRARGADGRGGQGAAGTAPLQLDVLARQAPQRFPACIHTHPPCWSVKCLDTRPLGVPERRNAPLRWEQRRRLKV